jgi:class 3 adenylate cyclase
MNNDLLQRESKKALAVIMTTGVVDITNRMLTDRQWTMSLLERDLNFIREQCAYYEGEIIQATEVGLVANFHDAVKAIECALDIQKTLTRAAATMQPRDILGHAIGLHLGDLVINGIEISGAAVTIASQLQLEANWGTIHISQSIYDRVKPTLDLEQNYTTNYVGEKYLQKIYQVLPKGFTSSIPVINSLNLIDIDAIEIIPKSSGEFIEPSRLLFDTVVSELEISQNIIDIKQLLLYICLDKWESDRSKLEKSNLKGLIQELLELTGTHSVLVSLITETTQTLERKYAPIGKIIVNEISKLYSDYQSEPQNIYDEITQSLEEINKDPTRIKRLLFYLCQQDLSQLDPQSLTLSVAIRELQNLYPSLEALRSRMKQALAVIKKPEYIAIMDVVIDELSAIYPGRSHSIPTVDSIISTPDSHQVNDKLAANLAEKSEKLIDEEIANLNLFDLRLEIIKYMSPLRVKILIFSALNNVSESTNDIITAIRTYELDDLLRDLFYAYKSPEKLEMQLQNRARLFKDIEEYEEAARVIMSAVMTIYKKLGIGN